MISELEATQDTKIPPLEIDFKIRDFAKKFLPDLGFSNYESAVLSICLSSRRPLRASEIFMVGDLPRTKIYYVAHRLIDIGCLINCTVTEDQVEHLKPEIYEYWPTHRQTAWLRERGVNRALYGVDLHFLKLRYTQKLEEKTLLIDQFTELMEAISIFNQGRRST